MSTLSRQTQFRSRALGLLEETGRLRREFGSQSPKLFAQCYLEDHCQLPFSRMHKEIFDVLAGITRTRNDRVAIAAPRGHAKSTIVSLGYTLWSALYEKEKHILIVSATQDQAIAHLRTVKEAVQTNAHLLTDFPQICRPPGAKGRPKPWRRDYFVLPNGVMIRACGANQSIRGLKSNQYRPSLIVGDDLEDKEQADSEDQREKLRDWFRSTLLKAGDASANVVVVGTVVHYDSLLANLISADKFLGWQKYKYKAIESFSDHPDLWDRWQATYRGLGDVEGHTGPEAAKAFFEANREIMLEGTAVLWPQLESYDNLMTVREREGGHSFQAEKQNEPLDPERCVFDEAKFHYWDDEFDDEQAIVAAARDSSDWGIFGACDPSLGRRAGRGDFTAIIVLAKNFKTKVHYVIAADVTHLNPSDTIGRIIQYGRMYRFDRFAVEANQFQQLLYEDLKERATKAEVQLSVYRIENRANKHARIANLEPMVSQGQIRFSRWHRELLDQLRQFPLATHDDGPDALEMAVQAARRIDYGPQMISVRHIG